MLTAIFPPEISQRELQVQQLQAQIQAQIAQTKERIKSLGKAERKASGAVSALQDAVAVLSTLAPESVSTLKSAVLSIFQIEDSYLQGSCLQQDGGNQSTNPPSEPGLDGQACVINAECYDEAYTVVLSEQNPESEILGSEKEAIAALEEQVDETSVAQAEVEQYLEEQAEAIAAEVVDNCLTREQLPAYSANPVGRRGAAAKWKAFQASGSQLNLEGSTGTTSIEKWRQAEESQKQQRTSSDDAQTEVMGDSEVTFFQVGDQVEIISDRQGDDLVWQIGTVTAATSSVGAAVEVAGQIRWFCTDEIVLLQEAAQIQAQAKEDLFPPLISV